MQGIDLLNKIVNEKEAPETINFEEDLMNNRVVMLNQNGVNRVVEIIKKKDKEIERLNNVINKALHKLRASKDHFKTERENNVVTFVIRILEGSDK